MHLVRIVEIRKDTLRRESNIRFGNGSLSEDWSIHTALLLQETVATSLETNRKCLVAYFDVAKAFDTVWIEGLFFQLYE